MLQIQDLRRFRRRTLWVSVVLLLFTTRICEAINYRPSFTRSSLVKTIPENVGAGYVIADIKDYTVDDEGDVITYSLDTYGSLICSINARSGRLTLNKPLDREAQASFKIIVSAQDNHQGGGQHRTAMLPVFLYVLDINDNAPIFTGTPYIATLPENTTVGSSILTVTAYDIDDGQNQDLTYSFKPGKGVEKFSISSENGVVTLAKRLDYEVEKKYALVVIAKDKGTPQNLESQTSLVIDVTDVCDTKPKFLKSSYQIQIDENQPLGSAILTVTAVDGDTAVNHPVRYAIIDGNEDGLFIIESTSGVLRVNGTLDRETNNIFKLKLKAWEVPDPTAFAVVDVMILLNDANDNKPMFKKQSYIFTVKEDAKPGYVLAEQFNAADADIEKVNNKFEYSLEGEKYVQNTFSINPVTGKLQIYGELDYEKQPNYTFSIRATETNTRQRFNSTANITVQVLNVNDNKPMFQRLIYVFRVMENITTQTVIGKVKAIDADAGTFGQVNYQIKSNKIGAPQFIINSLTGEIYTTRELAYSKARVHTFVVIATDQGGETSKSNRALVQIQLIEVKKPVTTTKATTTTKPTTIKTIKNDISEIVKRSERKYDSGKTTSGSTRTVNSNFMTILLLTILYLLRTLVT